jgi:hypothetical protein
MMRLVLASVLVLADHVQSGSKEARHIDSAHLELEQAGLFQDNEEGPDDNDISERVLDIGPNSLGAFKETFKNGFQDRSDWVPIPNTVPNKTDQLDRSYDTYVTPGGGTYANHNLETIYYQHPPPAYKEDTPIYVPHEGVANNPIYTANYQDHIAEPPIIPVHHVEEYCQTKGSYCLCHYCKCEKGLINCKNAGYGKKYCYGDSEGEFCSCDFCKCQHGYGVKGYGKCVH